MTMDARVRRVLPPAARDRREHTRVSCSTVASDRNWTTPHPVPLHGRLAPSCHMSCYACRAMLQLSPPFLHRTAQSAAAERHFSMILGAPDEAQHLGIFLTGFSPLGLVPAAAMRIPLSGLAVQFLACCAAWHGKCVAPLSCRQTAITKNFSVGRNDQEHTRAP